MVACDLCGGEEFEKHEGFMYCVVCQTQSQLYHEQEYDYQNHEFNVTKTIKPRTPKKRSSEKPVDDGFWTTWEAFNYILHGMTQELKNCGASEEVEKMIFKLWVAYLQESKVAFTSKLKEEIPKLGFDFKKRDLRILYNINLKSSNRCSARRKRRSHSSKVSSISNLSLESRNSLSARRGRMVAAEYQDYLQKSSQGSVSLADETLESLGRSDLDTSEESSDSHKSQMKSLKKVIIKKEYNQYKASVKSKKRKCRFGVRFLGKNKLLSLIYLALLLTGSEIQLSDLLRFIRESHLSFAKVTHFFPKEMKFPKKDFSYIEIITDFVMPTHLAQRQIMDHLVRFLRVEEIPTPDMASLIDRYCLDLNLPKQIAKFGRKILEGHIPSKSTLVDYKFEPNYEALAMSAIIIALKSLLGINDKTEIFLSNLALEINKSRQNKPSLFVFQDWQKFIECRKSVLMNFHYPTEEQLGSHFQSSKNFLGMLMKECKDDHRNDRFVRYRRQYIDEGFLQGVKDTLTTLSGPQKVVTFDFRPSLTPQVSNLETIMREISLEDFQFPSSITSLPEHVLKQDFKKCDLEFATDPKTYLNLLEENSDLFAKFGINRGLSQDSKGINENLDFLLNCSSHYWIVRFPDKIVTLREFDEGVLNKTPENFQWLIKECARMLEMTVRDLYTQLLELEVSVLRSDEKLLGSGTRKAGEKRIRLIE